MSFKRQLVYNNTGDRYGQYLSSEFLCIYFVHCIVPCNHNINRWLRTFFTQKKTGRLLITFPSYFTNKEIELCIMYGCHTDSVNMSPEYISLITFLVSHISDSFLRILKILYNCCFAQLYSL